MLYPQMSAGPAGSRTPPSKGLQPLLRQGTVLRGEQGSPGRRVTPDSSPPAVCLLRRHQGNACAILTAGETYFLVCCLLFAAYLLAKCPVSKGGDGADVTELQQQGWPAEGWLGIQGDPRKKGLG